MLKIKNKTDMRKDEDNVRTHEKIGKNYQFRKDQLFFFFSLLFSAAVGVIFFITTRKLLNSSIAFLVCSMVFFIYFFIRTKLEEASQIRKIEEVFPDFVSLMASNLRAGMTIDMALLLSSRKEFAPLDKEIMILGKDIATGKEITLALQDFSKRTNSNKISKTTKLIITGIKSGGNLAVLLEETSENIRERSFVEKRAASNVLMYTIFIFFAVSTGAPLLFGLSSVLVQILSQLMQNLPTEKVVTNVPFALTKISVSVNFIKYFSLVFLATSAFFSSLALGVVAKGKEKEGLKYLLPLLGISISVFYLTRFVLLNYFSNVY